MGTTATTRMTSENEGGRHRVSWGSSSKHTGRKHQAVSLPRGWARSGYDTLNRCALAVAALVVDGNLLGGDGGCNSYDGVGVHSGCVCGM